jgi:acetyl-CoA acetyltransferase
MMMSEAKAQELNLPVMARIRALPAWASIPP